MASSWDCFFEDSLTALKRQGRYRSLRVVDAVEGPWVQVNGARLLQFASNDYLGLAQDRRLRAAARRAVEESGLGAGASRLVTGNSSELSKLEAEVAAFKQTEAALIFPTGYAANVGVISALVSKDDRIISDRLNHASIVDGCRLSGARIDIYPHRDVAALRRLLAGARVGGRTLVITDGVFSMDGDVAPIPEILSLCRDYGALLMVDDAHGTGVLGKNGRGSLESLGVHDDSLVQIGTFSKALGSLGGFVAAKGVVVDYLINRARTQIYSTGLPAPVAAASARGWPSCPMNRNCASSWPRWSSGCVTESTLWASTFPTIPRPSSRWLSAPMKKPCGFPTNCCGPEFWRPPSAPHPFLPARAESA